MIVVSVRCYEELNDHLPAERRKVMFQHSLPGPASVSMLLKELGIPENEVDLILVNGESVSLDRPLASEDRVSVYPVFESFHIGTATNIRERPLRVPRFVLDVHLGKLAHLLRMLGFDTLYRNDYDDRMLLDLSVSEGRALLSRDRELLQSEHLTRCYLVREKDPKLQLGEVLDRFDLFDCALPFTRCIVCNGSLSPVEKEVVLSVLPAKVRQLYHEFRQCIECQRVYWQGSHYQRMREFIATVASGLTPRHSGRPPENPLQPPSSSRSTVQS
jgi:uncharacterized protein with PIN domain/sulfur carrier protein ThiS